MSLGIIWDVLLNIRRAADWVATALAAARAYSNCVSVCFFCVRCQVRAGRHYIWGNSGVRWLLQSLSCAILMEDGSQ